MDLLCPHHLAKDSNKRGAANRDIFGVWNWQAKKKVVHSLMGRWGGLSLGQGQTKLTVISVWLARVDVHFLPGNCSNRTQVMVNIKTCVSAGSGDKLTGEKWMTAWCSLRKLLYPSCFYLAILFHILKLKWWNLQLNIITALLLYYYVYSIQPMGSMLNSRGLGNTWRLLVACCGFTQLY